MCGKSIATCIQTDYTVLVVVSFINHSNKKTLSQFEVSTVRDVGKSIATCIQADYTVLAVVSLINHSNKKVRSVCLCTYIHVLHMFNTLLLTNQSLGSGDRIHESVRE